MSVERLILKQGYNNKQARIEILGKGVEIIISVKNVDVEWIVLDHNQAHLLMLYLQEHLSK